MTAPSFDDIFAVMSLAAVGDMKARVLLPENPDVDDMATKLALGLNILLDDLSLKATEAERELAEHARLSRRVQSLADASREFSAATGDLEELLEVIARRLGDLVGDLCTIRPMSDDGEWLESVGAVYHRDPAVLAAAREAVSSVRQPALAGTLGRVVATGKAVRIPVIDTAAFAASTDPKYADFVNRVGVASSITAPLMCRGKVVGIAALLRNTPGRPYTEDDLLLVESVTDHAALAIANARSHAAERAARAAAEKATARFARLSEAGIIGTLVTDLDTGVVDVNETLLRIVGYSRDEILSGRVVWADLTPPEWRDVDARAVEQLTASGVAGLREKEYVRKDGTRVPVLAGSAMLGEDSRECVSFVLDLTERKEAERARHAAERRSQRIVESAAVGLWMLDTEARTTFMNAAMAGIAGAPLATATRMPTSEFFFAEDRPKIAERLAQRRQGIADAFEQRFRRADGAIALLWIESSPLYDAQGRYEGLLGIVTDITQRRQTEEALRASEARYRLMFDNSPLPKWMYDTTTLSFLDANEAAIREYGYTRDELLGMTIKDIRPPEDVPALLEAEKNADVSPKFGIWRLLRKTGEIIQVEITKHAFKLGDRTLRLAVGRDVTERLRLEDQLRQSQKMDAVGRLAGGIAHDFNNVLSVILSYAEMLMSGLKADEPMRADVEEIYKAGKRATGLTRQLLMFSRQQVLAPRVLDLNDLLTNMDKMLQRILGADVDLVSLPARPLGRVRGDPSSLEQVIMNLVVNARDAMPTGGQLTMETANVVLDDAYAAAHLGVNAGPHVMLAVTDTGTGIDKATLARIFEPFFTTKPIGKGTGMGLSTVFGVVQQSGGSVWVYSEVGKGTTFKVYLPRVDEAVDMPRDTETPATSQGSETVLLVEDDEAMRAVASAILRKRGYHVIEARNAGEALLHSEGHAGTIDLLLSDVVMPQMSGPALAKRLASARPEMKVLCMSGYTDDSIVRHGVLDAHFAFLQKPFTSESLALRVREVLDEASHRPPG